MTTQRTTEAIREAGVFAFLTKLNTWAHHLSSTERACLEALLVRAAGANQKDVEGFLMKAQPYIPELRPVPSPESSTSIVNPTGGGFLLGQLRTHDLTPLTEGMRTFGGL